MKHKLLTVLISLSVCGLVSSSHGQTITGDTFTDPLTAADSYWTPTATISYSAAGSTLSAQSSDGNPAASLDVLNLGSGDLPASLTGDFSLSFNLTGLDLNSGAFALQFELASAGTTQGGDTDGADPYIALENINIVTAPDYIIYGTSDGTGGFYILGTNSVTSGTFSASRTAGVMTLDFNGYSITDTNSSDVGTIELGVLSEDTNNPTSATVSDFSLQNSGISATATPEPNTIALAGISCIAFVALLRRK